MQGADWSPAGFRADLLAAAAAQTQSLQGHTVVDTRRLVW
jgi:hypothetical protein